MGNRFVGDQAMDNQCLDNLSERNRSERNLSQHKPSVSTHPMWNCFEFTWVRFLWMVPVFWVLTSCSSVKQTNVERGTQYRFQEGYPELRIAAIGLLDDSDQAYINITSEIVYGSLIYKERDDVQVALIRYEIRANQVDGTESFGFQKELQIDTDQKIPFLNQDVMTLRNDLEVVPGTFDISISVTDLISGKTTIRETNTIIPDPENPKVNLTSIRLATNKQFQPGIDAGYTPVTTYAVGSTVDSLKFDFQVTNNNLAEPLRVESRLLSFTADSTAANPLHFNNYSPSSIQYLGLEYRNADLLYETTRVLQDPGSVTMEFYFPLPERGNYRFEVNVLGSDDDESTYRARDFAVKSKNYPNIQSAREMAAPLIYLMDKKDHSKLMAETDPATLKSKVDRFWLTNIGEQNTAKAVLSLYYDRVEKANKLFGNYKEGWKTDMGMMYILFGPPWYIERRLDGMWWSYSYDRNDPEYNFYFERTKINTAYYPFDNFMLRRDVGYFNRQYQQVQLWLTGGILQRNL